MRKSSEILWNCKKQRKNQDVKVPCFSGLLWVTSKNPGGKNERCAGGRECFAKKVTYHLGLTKFTGYPLVVKTNPTSACGTKKTRNVIYLLRSLTEWFVLQKVNLRCWKRAIFYRLFLHTEPITRMDMGDFISPIM